MGKKTVKILFFLYCIGMLWLMFGQRVRADRNGLPYWQAVSQHFNPIPFQTIRWFATVGNKTSNRYLLLHAFINLAGNVVMFIPLGGLLPAVWQKLGKFWKTLLMSAGIVLAAEVIQMLTLLGVCDVDDLILNLLGVMVGYGLWKLTARRQS